MRMRSYSSEHFSEGERMLLLMHVAAYFRSRDIGVRFWQTASQLRSFSASQIRKDGAAPSSGGCGWCSRAAMVPPHAVERCSGRADVGRAMLRRYVVQLCECVIMWTPACTAAPVRSAGRPLRTYAYMRKAHVGIYSPFFFACAARGHPPM